MNWSKTKWVAFLLLGALGLLVQFYIKTASQPMPKTTVYSETIDVGKRDEPTNTNTRRKVITMTDKLPYSPISDERIDDAVICYLQEYPRHRVIKWGSIEFRLTDVSKTT